MKKSVVICLVSLALSLLFVFASYASEPTWTYNQLATKDLNQMSQLVKTALKKAKTKTGVDPDVLREITRTVFMRANRDRMIDKVYPDIRSVLDDNDLIESTFTALVGDAISDLKKDDVRPEVQVSQEILLENFMSEFKPSITEGWVRKLYEQIREAKIEISNKASSERKLRMMEEVKSPSEIAGTLLDKTAEKPADKK